MALLGHPAQYVIHPFYPRAAKERNLRAARSDPGFLGLHEGDVRDAKRVRQALDAHEPEAVVHLAARAGVRPSLDAPEEYADVNVTGTAVVLKEASARGVGRVLFASSSSVYGEKPRGPFVEDADADHPISPYGATKRSGELLSYAQHRATGLNVTCVRIFTAFGPRQRPDLAIHRFARRMLAGEEIPVYGDGTAERDFTFVGGCNSILLRWHNRRKTKV